MAPLSITCVFLFTFVAKEEAETGLSRCLLPVEMLNVGRSK